MSRQSKPRVRLRVEQLEARDIPAGHILFNPATGVVNVLGTARNDVLTVSPGAHHTVSVTLTGGARQTVRLPASQVREVLFHGNGGRDRFLNRTAVPVFLGAGPSFFQFAPWGGLGFLPGLGGPPAGAAPSSPRPIPVTPVPGLTDAEALILEETNYYRTSHGLAPLTLNPLLEQAAHGLAAAEAAADRYGDTDTNGHVFQGHDMVWRAAQVGYQWSNLGENVAYNQGYADPAQELMDQWWNSPEHQANMLDPNFTEIGVGVAVGASGRTYGVQDFGSPA